MSAGQSSTSHGHYGDYRGSGLPAVLQWTAQVVTISGSLEFRFRAAIIDTGYVGRFKVRLGVLGNQAIRHWFAFFSDHGDVIQWLAGD